MRRLAGLIVIVIVILVLVLSSKPAETPQGGAKSYCSSDSDCVQEQCCHATSAVNKAYAPDCRNTACTMECRGGTLDCGYGDIKGVDWKCQVILK